MAAETIKGDRGGIGLTGMATQSSISVSGSSEQKVPSVRKGGRGGGGNRNSGGGPGHSGHSVLSSVSSSSILHLNVLKTTRKINARLILLTELLIGGGGEALSLPPLTHHLPNLFHLPSLLLLFFFFFFRLAWRVDFFFSLLPPPPPPSFSAELLSLESNGVFSFLPRKPNYSFQTRAPGLERRKTQGTGETIYAGNLVTWVEPRSYANNSSRERKQKGETTAKEGKGKGGGGVVEDKLVSKRGYLVEGKQGAAHELRGKGRG